MPKFIPTKKYRRTASTDIAAEHGKLQRLKRMNGNLVFVGKYWISIMTRTSLCDREGLGLGVAVPCRHKQARNRVGREHRRENADGERHGEAANRPRSQEEEDPAGEQGREVRVDDGAERSSETLVERRDGGTTESRLLADALIDEHVGVDRHADGEQDARDAGERERSTEHRQNAEDHAHVYDNRQHRDDAEESVGSDHERRDQAGSDPERKLAGADRILA